MNAQNLNLTHVRYWNSENLTFSEPVDFQIKNGILTSILPHKSSGKIPTKSYYVVPGFCDAYVTLGVNPWGGQAGPDSLKITLQTLVSHGFTHVESVADGDWIPKVQNLLNKNNWKGPVLSRGRSPLLPSSELAIAKGTYEPISSNEDMKRILSKPSNLRTHIFHRNMGEYVPDLRFLYKLRVEYSKNQNWVIHTFADPVSSEEALATGWEVIFHPINASPPQFQLDKVSWSPLMGIYYFQTMRNLDAWESERKKLLERSAYFNLSFGEVSKDPGEFLYKEDELAQAKKEYSLYISQLNSRESMKKKLIFGSGTGHPLVFPGVGALKEMDIWQDAFLFWSSSNKKNLIDEESSSLKKSVWSKLKNILMGEEEQKKVELPRVEPSKIPHFRKEFFDIFTRNSCEFVGAAHKGVIQKGREANLVLYESNPLATKNGLDQPVVVLVKGRIQSGKINK